MESTAEPTQGRETKGASWIVFVFVIPALVAVILAGVVLQIIGSPIMKTVDGYIGLGKTSTSQSVVKPSTQASSQSMFLIERARYRQEVKVANRLRSELQAADTQVKSLTKKIGTLEATLKTKTSVTKAAKAEAQILQTMPAATAASMLGKLSVNAAAGAIAQMPPSTAGAILALISPAKADQIMVQASSMTHP